MKRRDSLGILTAYSARTQPVIDPPQADVELNVLFAPCCLPVDTRSPFLRITTTTSSQAHS